MPDLSKVMTCTCPSNFSWSRAFDGSNGRKNEHLVTFDERNGYHCSCPGFQYRKKCKHVDESHGLRCGWGADAWANVIHDEEFCPECGEKTMPLYVGV